MQTAILGVMDAKADNDKTDNVFRSRLIADTDDNGELSAAVQLRASKMSVAYKRKVSKSEVVVEILREALTAELAEVRKFQGSKRGKG